MPLLLSLSQNGSHYMFGCNAVVIGARIDYNAGIVYRPLQNIDVRLWWGAVSMRQVLIKTWVFRNACGKILLLASGGN